MSLLESMEPEYGVAADVHSFTAACVALKQSRMEGHEALLEALRLEALIAESGEWQWQQIGISS